MKNEDGRLPDATLESLVRSFFKESSSYGFSQIDYVRFVNMLLDLSMESNLADPAKGESHEGAIDYVRSPDERLRQLPIQGERIHIRKFDAEKDIEILKGWLSDKSGRQFLLSRITAQTIDVERVVNDHWNIVGMVTTLDNKPIGCVAYLGYNCAQNKAELRKLIGEPSMRGKGYAKEATQLWIRYGFEALDLKKIYLSTLQTDIRNIRLNENLGFKVEGILRNEICVDGIYRDVLRMGLWRD